MREITLINLLINYLKHGRLNFMMKRRKYKISRGMGMATEEATTHIGLFNLAYLSNSHKLKCNIFGYVMNNADFSDIV